MLAGRKHLYEFGSFRLDPSERLLLRDGKAVPLSPKAFDTLILLVENAGHLMTKEELLKRLWPETFVEEVNLAQNISVLRRALDSDPGATPHIETVPKLGYRFVAPVKVEGSENGEEALIGPETAAHPATPKKGRAKPSKLPGTKIWLSTACGILAIAGLATWVLASRPVLSFHERDSVLIADFENHTGDPRFDDALLTAFTVSLEQSRYANIVPRGRVEAALKRMGKAPKEHVSAEIAREICQRENLRGLIAAEITRTGQQFGLFARLIDPLTGVAVRSHSQRVHGEDQVLDALDRIAGDIRADLGESLYQIRRADRPLPQVTTASLSALKQFADGQALWHSARYPEAITQLSGAVRLDPDFAMAHAALGNAYCSGIAGFQREHCEREYRKALSLSSRVTDRERRLIELAYNGSLGYVDTADALYRSYLRDYPDDWVVRNSYARQLRLHGKQAEAIQQYKEVLRLDPNDAGSYVDIATSYKGMGNPGEAILAYAEAFRLQPAWLSVSNINREYGLTLVANGEEYKAEQVFSALASDPKGRTSGLDSLGLLDLMHGRYAKAHGRFEQALASAEQQRDAFLTARNHILLAMEAGGAGDKAQQLGELGAALSDFGNLGPKVEYGSIVGQEYARAGAVDKAKKIAGRIAPLVDQNSNEQSGYLRLLQGEIALAKGDAGNAMKLFDLQDPRYGSGSVVPISIEALARAFLKAGKVDDAIHFYELLLEPRAENCRLNGWVEVQQRCVEARLALTAEYLRHGDKQKARNVLVPLLKQWHDADKNLVLTARLSELAAQTAE